jgi:hypothetical protein
MPSAPHLSQPPVDPPYPVGVFEGHFHCLPGHGEQLLVPHPPHPARPTPSGKYSGLATHTSAPFFQTSATLLPRRSYRGLARASKTHPPARGLATATAPAEPFGSSPAPTSPSHLAEDLGNLPYHLGALPEGHLGERLASRATGGRRPASSASGALCPISGRNVQRLRSRDRRAVWC